MNPNEIVHVTGNIYDKGILKPINLHITYKEALDFKSTLQTKGYTNNIQAIQCTAHDPDTGLPLFNVN